MELKQIFVSLLLIIGSISQTISIADLKKNSTFMLPAFCLKANNRNECTQCQNLYALVAGICMRTQVSTEEKAVDPTDDENFVPCQSSSCGEAKNFRNQSQFENFIKNYSKEFSTSDLKIPIIRNAQNKNIRYQIRQVNNLLINDFSGTNNQAYGIDQADILQTDGTYIYTISRNILSIILAYPVSQARLVSSISFATFTPSSMFIQGNYLAVVGTQISSSSTHTFVKIYDVSNRFNPYLVKEYQVEGTYLNGKKLSNGFIYLVSTHSFRLVGRPFPWFDFGLGRKEVPFASIFRYPRTYGTLYAVNIISFNLSSPLTSQKNIITICAQSARTIYMSEKHLYLANPSYENGVGYTLIRKIFVSGRRIIPFADAKVRGIVNNQFSMDQYSPFLRIATTNSDGDFSNNVFCLDYYLRPYGSLTRIAPGERIFSARYTKNRLYLATFRQIDPFFVISLSDHKRPAILGELKIPVFSRYIHPYDQTTIIGLGRDAHLNGVQKGLRISLFDVSNVLRPVQRAFFEIEDKYASSKAQWDHKAFLFSESKNLLVIPAHMEFNRTKFNGAFAFNINKNKIELKSIINHMLTSNDSFELGYVERSLLIEQYLYTKSQCLIRINRIGQMFEGVKNINIPCSQTRIPPR